MKSFLLIGMGKFGHHLCRDLAELDNEIMIADENEDKMSDLLDCVISAKIGDCTKEEVLRTFGVDEFDACIVCIGDDFQNSLEVTNQLKELGAKYVISLASTNIQAKFLLANGADEVIYPERDISGRVAASISNDSIFDYIILADGFSIFEICPPEKWIGKTILDLNVRAKYHISILAIKKDGKITVMPDAKYIFKSDEHLIVMGKDEDIKRLVG